MPNYTKLFNSIVTSTIWMESDQTRIVWITMLAIADQHGEVHASIPGLARLSGVSIDATRKAIDTFLAPDPDSRTPENEGRRVAAIDGGWELLNHAKYRAMASKEDSKKATADRVKRYRERNAHVTVCNGDVTPCNGTVTVQRDIAEAEAEAEAEITPPNPQGGSADAPALVLEIEKPKGSSRQPPKKADDEEWLNEIATNPAYAGINVRHELGKMQAWCSVNRKQPSRQRFINWLNRAERPIAALSKNQAYDAKSATAGKTREQVLDF